MDKVGVEGAVYRAADVTGADRPALFALWRQVFGDGDDFVAMVLDGFAGRGNVHVAEENGVVTAMLSAVPCVAGNGCKGVYLYALATRPERRGRGVMGGLMRWAEARAAQAGAAFAALIPADEGLYRYYMARGYTHVAGLRRMVLERPRQAGLPFGHSGPDGTAFAALRAHYLGRPSVWFEGARANLALADLLGEGALVAQTAEAYAVYALRGDELQVAELGAGDDTAADALLAGLMDAMRVGRARVAVPAESSLYGGQGETVPAALAKPLLPGGLSEGFYLRFGMDGPFGLFGMWRDTAPPGGT